jgi:hypothetical protein
MPSGKPSRQKTRTRKPAMSIDFEVPAEANAIRAKVRNGCRKNVSRGKEPTPSRSMKSGAAAHQGTRAGPMVSVRAEGIWRHGPALSPTLVQMELGESMLGALSMNTQGPDDASLMMTILEHGTDYQKEKFLNPCSTATSASASHRGGWRRCDGHADVSGEGRQRKLYPQRREVVLLLRQRRRWRW